MSTSRDGEREPAYRMFELLQVRVTGVPFGVLDRLANCELARDARTVIALDADVGQIANEALDSLRASRDLARSRRHALTKALQLRRMVVLDQEPRLPALERYNERLAERERARASLEASVVTAFDRSTAELWQIASAVLPSYLVFESIEMMQFLLRRSDRGLAADSRDRKVSRSLALYLQRIAAKNDSISRFGPVGWGTLVAGRGLSIRPEAEIGAREVQVERWVVRAFASAMNSDPDVRPEIAPRIHPSGRVEGSTFVRLDLGSETPLSPDQLALLARCNGHTPAHALGAPEALAALAAAGIAIWEVELVPWDTKPLATLIADVTAWRDGAAKQRWLPELDKLLALARDYARDERPVARAEIAARVVASVEARGGSAPSREGVLYAATNAIVEDCFRECGLTVGADSIVTLLRDAEPWFDLYRDVYSFAASHAFERLRPLFSAAPRRHGVLTLASFMSYLAKHDLALQGAGLAKLGAEAFEQVRDEMRERTSSRADAAQWQLTTDDCRFLRERHRFPFVDEGTWPSADLQVVAASPEAAARGELEWILAEIHQSGAVLQHAIYWSCPDKPKLHGALARSTAGRAWLAHSRAGFFATLHTAVEPMMDAFPSRFVAPERARPHWHAIPPAEAEVVMDEEARDLRVRGPDGADLGSINRSQWLFFGFHPFLPLSIAPHTPRLRVGDVVVQRETWLVRWDELGLTKLPQGVTAEALLAVERLRRARGIPRWIFARASGSALDRTSAFGRRKDAKPFYVDLESLLFVDIFTRRLEQYGDLEVLEMLPNPEQLVWREPDGDRTFELRTLIEPIAR